MRKVIAIAAVAALGFGLTACEDTETGAQHEQQARLGAYERLVKNQPADTMDYSNTRETIRKWVDRWDEKGKLSYVYLQNANGDLLGYYILKGLPVSYCASLTPNYDLIDVDHDGDRAPDFQVPAPGVDGVYYGGSGSCNTYYGFDATTDNYIEYTAGLGINVLLYDQPLPRQDVAPLGPSSVKDVR